MTATATLPIGIFDSGVGGLTVLRAITERLPDEHLLYLGDTARLPYGTKGPDTIVRYTQQAASKLVERGVKMLVVACNTATAAALPTLQQHFAPLPVIGVIEPGAAAAVKASRNAHIAVIATEATIKRHAYHDAILRHNPQARVTGQPCTLFVPLAEEGWMDGPLVEGIAARYLDPLFQAADKPDTLLLGCTHFPILKTALQKVVGSKIHIVDSAATTALAVEEKLRELSLLHPHTDPAEPHFLTTDDPGRFARTGALFLGKALPAELVELVDL